jgi:hypothetical protein
VLAKVRLTNELTSIPSGDEPREGDGDSGYARHSIDSTVGPLLRTSLVPRSPGDTRITKDLEYKALDPCSCAR